MTPTVDDVSAWEVLDSRGTPTVRVTVKSAGEHATFTVPAGASTGSHEAHEHRDGGERYGGQGVREAVAAVEEELAPAVVGRAVHDQRGLDATLDDVDGTDDLGRVGANAVLGVSGATLRAAAAVADWPLYRYLADRYADATPTLPTPMVNVLSGGLHAEGGVEIQDVLVVPTAASSFGEAIETVWAVRNAVRERIVADGHRPLVADEGGFSPPVGSIEAAFEYVVDSIKVAGYEPGGEVALAVDVAALHFYDEDRGVYRLDSAGETLARERMVERVVNWVEAFPIVSVEDPLHEDDWSGWADLASRLPDGVQLLGDDLLVTNVERLDRAIDRNATTAVLVKPNQAGTMSRTFEVVGRATDAGVAPVVSARSGETCDHTVADLATGFGTGQIKIGSLARSERLAKYNRLLKIESVDGVGYDAE